MNSAPGCSYRFAREKKTRELLNPILKRKRRKLVAIPCPVIQPLSRRLYPNLDRPEHELEDTEDAHSGE